jgi:hypothetical protein
MKITNTYGKAIVVGFLGEHGRKLAIGETILVDDKYAGHPSMADMIANGVVTVSGYSVDDEYSLKDNYVSSAEFNHTVKGLYVVPSTWTSTGTPTASATGKAVEGSAVGPFDLTLYHVLRIKFNSNTEVTVVLDKGQYDITTLVNALNGDAEFAKYGLATSAAGKLKITSLCVGTNSEIEFLDEPRSAVSKVYMDSPTTTAPTGTIAVVKIDTHNTIGLGLAGVTHAIKLYTTDVGGGSVVSSEFVIQRITKGTLVSGLTTAEASITTDSDGKLEFEVATSVAITEAADWVAVVIPSTHYFAICPAGRLQTL